MRNYTTVLGVLCVMAAMAGCVSYKATGGPVQGAELHDGIYQGAATEGPVSVVAEVTILDRRIAKVDLIQHRNWKGGAAGDVIPDRIIEAQSTDVDGVSGATMSSVVIMNAVEDAVRKAQ